MTMAKGSIEVQPLLRHPELLIYLGYVKSQAFEASAYDMKNKSQP
jgi:hypothetical protein